MAEVEREDRRRRAARTFRDAILLLALLAVLPTVRVSFPDRPGAHAADAPMSPAPASAPAVVRPPAHADPNCPVSDDGSPVRRAAEVRVVAAKVSDLATRCVPPQG